jgi:hypothetical protein
VGRVAEVADEEPVTVRIAVVRQREDQEHTEAIRRGSGINRVVHRHRRPILRPYRDEDGRRVGAAVTVTDLIGEAVRADIVEGGGVDDRIGAAAADGAVGRRAERRGRERVAVDIGVVVQHRDGDRDVLVGQKRVVGSVGRVVDGVDEDGDCGLVEFAVTVGNNIREIILAGIVRLRRIDDEGVEVVQRIVVDGDRPMPRVGRVHDGKRVAVRIGIIDQRMDVNRRVLVGLDNVEVCNRRIVVGRDREGDK